MKGLRGMKPGEVRVVERKRPHHEIIDPDLVFPGCRQMPSRTGLPMAGNALRHTFKTLHVSLRDIGDTVALPDGSRARRRVCEVHRRVDRGIHGPALRKAQEKISAHVFELLGLKLQRPHSLR